MKFSEKLENLRKSKGMSQEALAQKLNVTRQTVSKWELGQTTPEMDKLVEMSKIFNITVDELINESETTTNVNPIIEDQPIGNGKTKSNKMVIIIVVALIAVLIFIGIKILPIFTAFNLFNKTADQVLGVQEEIVGEESLNFFQKLFSLANKELDKQLAEQEKENNTNNEIDVNIFNKTLEYYNGSQSGRDIKDLLEKVIKINKTEDKKITVKYNELETENVEEIQNLKMNLKNSNSFEVIFDYDEEKYINKVTIQKVITESEIHSFNNSLEFYAGSSTAPQVEIVLDKIITSNKTQDRKITVKYKGTETQDENAIKNIKRDFGTFDEGEISYEYDIDGFINKAIIEKL